MGDWHDFLLALAGAAGVLTGLVFVGVSINLEKIISQPGFGLSGRAAEALILLSGRAHGVLPVARAGAGHGYGRGRGARDRARRLGLGRGHPAAAAEGLAGDGACAPSSLRAAGGARAGRHAAVRGRRDRRAGRGLGGLYWLVAGTLFSILVALFDAWVLLIEINR
jgi:hypothetical protein